MFKMDGCSSSDEKEIKPSTNVMDENSSNDEQEIKPSTNVIEETPPQIQSNFFLPKYSDRAENLKGLKAKKDSQLPTESHNTKETNSKHLNNNSISPKKYKCYVDPSSPPLVQEYMRQFSPRDFNNVPSSPKQTGSMNKNNNSSENEFYFSSHTRIIERTSKNSQNPVKENDIGVSYQSCSPHLQDRKEQHRYLQNINLTAVVQDSSIESINLDESASGQSKFFDKKKTNNASTKFNECTTNKSNFFDTSAKKVTSNEEVNIETSNDAGSLDETEISNCLNNNS